MRVGPATGKLRLARATPYFNNIACPPQGGNRGGCSVSLMRMGRNPALPLCHTHAGLTSLSTNGCTAMRAPGQ
jgi:hypothetical protein